MKPLRSTWPTTPTPSGDRSQAWHRQLAGKSTSAAMGDAAVLGAPTFGEHSGSPLFTIAIPTFNRAKWLGPCVRSALSQSVTSFEVIVSDNASSDETGEVLRQFSDQRLTVLRQRSNIGPIRNWNACLAAARGAYIVMLSDDDSVAPHFLERCSALITNDVAIPVVVSLGDVFHAETGFSQPAVASHLLRSGVYDGTEILLEFLRSRISPQMCTVAIETETLRAGGGFPHGWPHTGDLVTWVPLLLRGKAGFVNESCGTYCSHQETQTAKLSLGSRLNDIDRLASVILEETAQRIHDPRIAATIQKFVRRYVARNFLGHMASARKCGASRRDIAAVAWAWRRGLSGAPVDMRTFARSVAMFVMPLPVIHTVSRARRVLRGLV